jgi:cystine transport system substrate-binding protein
MLAVLVLIFFALVRPRIVAEQSWQAIRMSGTLRIGTNPELAPFSFYDASGWQGFDAELGHELASRLDLSLTADPVGYDGLYDALMTRRTDIALSAVVIDPSRTQDVAYSQPYFDSGLRVIAPVTMTRSKTLRSGDPASSLSGGRIAVAFGSEADRAGRHLERRIAGVSREVVADEAHVLDAIRIGTSDVGIVSADTALKAGCARIDQGARVQPSTLDARRDASVWLWQCVPLQPVPFVVAVRDDDTRLLDEIDRALNAMEADGTLNRLAEKWFRAP